MIENVLNRIGGVGVYGVISICLFVAVFIGVVVWTLCLKKRYVNKMRNLPLDDSATPESDTEPTPNPQDRHE